jgi:23S rRNA (guanosine2251-2'-O)-methyltransferase
MYIYGRNPIIEALRSEADIAKIYLRFGTHGESILLIRQLARKRKVPLIELSRDKFTRLNAPQEAQGVVALIEDIPLFSLADLLTSAPEDEPAFFIALDEITDPHNTGAIVRSASCAGAHGVILPERNSAMINDTVVKVSAGATSHIRIARVGNLHKALLELREKNIWIAGLDSRGDKDLFALDGSLPVCLVIGAEGKGLRPLIRKTCDFIVSIPMWGKVDSLNASVAAALALYEIRRKR